MVTELFGVATDDYEKITEVRNKGNNKVIKPLAKKHLPKTGS
jgi:hypothetical protein